MLCGFYWTWAYLMLDPGRATFRIGWATSAFYHLATLAAISWFQSDTKEHDGGGAGDRAVKKKKEHHPFFVFRDSVENKMIGEEEKWDRQSRALQLSTTAANRAGQKPAIGKKRVLCSPAMAILNNFRRRNLDLHHSKESQDFLKLKWSQGCLVCSFKQFFLMLMKIFMKLAFCSSLPCFHHLCSGTPI